ncbi:MAG: DegV family protein [Clostridia bacterium]|nr:DegV family protein [Clostridia bacterium]
MTKFYKIRKKILTGYEFCDIIIKEYQVRSKNMALFAVSTDSTSDLKKEYVQKRNIWFVPLTFTLEKDGKIEEGVDDFSTQQEYVAFYNKVRENYFPRTAKLNYDAHVEHFTKMAKAGVKDVLHFMISSGLANTITITVQAAADVKKEYPDFNVYAVDPLTATVGQGMLVGLAADCRDNGMSAKDTYDYLMNVRNNIQHCIIPADLFYLKKGGRVSAVSAAIGTMLNIKPMLAFDKDGKLTVLEKCKGLKKAYARVIDHIAKAGIDEKSIVIVVHTDNESGANELAALIEKMYGVQVEITIMGPVIGSHVGPNSVSCCWLSKTTREQLHANL